MKVFETALSGVLLIEPKVLGDSRGFFKESFQAERYHEAGITLPFVQDNHSRSQRGVLRGLHLQKSRPQGKLVSCSRGLVYDVAVDIDPTSLTFGQYVGVELSEDNHLQLWIPPGYAHGFCVLSEVADFQYKCTDFYFPEDEGGLIWNDAEVSIDWPITDIRLSEKDLKLPTLEQIRSRGT
ncbi:dTDP-4-dehydrorhamnose 3,5-epimerase [Gammaproteobacteria bacterium]|nr:dTDP-4-dehydrorhamnose 3,5-epimerase [Gammaproteobacteria bacterium]